MKISLFIMVLSMCKFASAGWLCSLKCRVFGPCDCPLKKLDFENISQQVVGQHIAINAVVTYVNHHIDNVNPDKALSLSFHGGTGVGKTFLSNIIVNYMYNDAYTKNTCVHVFNPDVSFKHAAQLGEYMISIKTAIEEIAKQCERPTYIFEELEDMPPGLIDVMKVYLGSYEQVNGRDYRKAIFLFLSNIGKTNIVNEAHALELDGMSRTELKLEHFEDALTKESFSRYGGGFSQSSILSSGLMTAYLPFLPLTREHVKHCIKQQIKKNKFDATERNINDIADLLRYYPEEKDEQVFSVFGCKRIPEKTLLCFSEKNDL